MIETCKTCRYEDEDPSSVHCCGCDTQDEWTPKQEKIMEAPIRRFDTGATRDTDSGKLSYVKGLSAAVLHRYMTYLLAHRKQPDGSMREFDNWKLGIPDECYLDSLVRHTMDLWRMDEGAAVEDNHGPVTEEDLLCAIIFNAHGKLHELLKLREEYP